MDLYRILHQEPFQPVRVHLRDGRAYDILYPYQAVVGFHIGIPAPDLPEGIYDYIEYLDLTDIFFQDRNRRRTRGRSRAWYYDLQNRMINLLGRGEMATDRTGALNVYEIQNLCAPDTSWAWRGDHAGTGTLQYAAARTTLREAR